MSTSTVQKHLAVNLEFKNLSYSVRDSTSGNYAGFMLGGSQNMKKILKDVSGIFKSGELTAIMGPSGAGKSTLMNILAGYKTHNIEGSVSVNGKLRDLAQFRKMSCYIMQDDVLLPALTVQESMQFAARLKLPLNYTKETRDLIINKILEQIGLVECKNVRTVNISGGQRKRLSIALELINNPPVMFFDEFSTGLDSSSSFNCVMLLKALAQDGRTIIASIHQPSARILEQFDSLYLLGDGQCLYRGLVKSVVPYFASQGLQCPLYDNPADFAIEVASGFFSEAALEAVLKALKLDNVNLAQNSGSNGNSKNTDGHNVTSTFKSDFLEREKGNENADMITCLVNPLETTISIEQKYSAYAKYQNEFFTLLRRSILCIIRDRMLVGVRFAATIAFGLFIGEIYYGIGNEATRVLENTGYIYFGFTFMVLFSIMPTVIKFPMERDVLIREHLNCWYSLKSYYMARIIAELPIQLFFPLLYTLITYFMTGQPLEVFRFLVITGMYIMVALIAQSTGLLIGAACDLQTSVMAGPVTVIPLLIFGGICSFSLDGVPLYVRWISWFSYIRYAFQVCLTALYGYNREDLNCTQAFCLLKSPKRILSELDVQPINIFGESCYLFSFVLISQILAYFALKIRIIAEKA